LERRLLSLAITPVQWVTRLTSAGEHVPSTNQQQDARPPTNGSFESRNSATVSGRATMMTHTLGEKIDCCPRFSRSEELRRC
jgi:hypothetical protein